MSKICYNCGTENAESERFCHNCSAALDRPEELKEAGLQAGTGEERTLWDNGEMQLTTEAVLIGMNSDAPDVVPLNTIYEIEVDEGCVVLRVKDGDDRYCMLAEPDELAALIKEQAFRPRLSHSRKGHNYIPPE
jgi:hypothetical protein